MWYTDLHQETQQCANKGSEEECKLVNVHINNVGLKMDQKTALQMFYEDRNDSLWALKDTETVFLSKTKHEIVGESVYLEFPQGVFKPS